MICLWRSSVGVYLVGALSDEERIRMYAHLDECAECHREFCDLAPVVVFLAGASPGPGPGPCAEW
jgi:anti-sigma factor RsiW